MERIGEAPHPARSRTQRSRDHLRRPGVGIADKTYLSGAQQVRARTTLRERSQRSLSNQDEPGRARRAWTRERRRARRGAMCGCSPLRLQRKAPASLGSWVTEEPAVTGVSYLSLRFLAQRAFAARRA